MLIYKRSRGYDENKISENLKDAKIKKLTNKFFYTNNGEAIVINNNFNKGLLLGTLNAFVDQNIFRGNAPWTLKHHIKDNNSLKNIKNSKKILYPSKKDNIYSFDRLTNVSFSGTNHKEDQPNHLKIINEAIPIEHNYEKYLSPEIRYCPAGVYEIINIENEGPSLQINFQNCLHCKTCDIKDPLQNISWTPPEGGEGPRYSNM